MSEQAGHDTLPLDIPQQVRSNVLAFEPDAAAETFRFDNLQSIIPVFTYNGLPQDRKCIRLLRLYPGVLVNPQVDCELFEAEFDQYYDLVKIQYPEATELSLNAKIMKETRKKDVIKYEALSWRWGDERHGECAVMIHRDGLLYRKRVSRTLGLALKYLRIEKDRILWIDAICINQEDDDERSSQVSMMSLVYAGAKQVCVWLGEGDAESTMAIRFIQEELRGLKDFDRLCTDKNNARKWEALFALMQRPWFSRRWVIQEVVLARAATVYCGLNEISWRELAVAVELFVEVETATHRLSELMKKDEKYNLIPNLFGHISELGASLLINATARVFRESRHGGMDLDQRSVLSLEYLVTSLFIFDCGRPHDSIYALVAIATDAYPTTPSFFSKRTNAALIAKLFSSVLEQKPYILDYNRSYADACKDFVHFCILRCASTDKGQALNILCRPWAKDWRPGDHSPQDPKDSFKNPEVNYPKRTTFIKHEEPWTLRLKFGELKQKSQSYGGEYLAELLEELRPEAERTELSDDTIVNLVDKRDSRTYWETARMRYPVHHILMQWFKPRGFETNNMDSAEGEAAKAGTRVLKRRKGKKSKNNQQGSLGSDMRENHDLALPSSVARITAAPFDIFLHPGMDTVKMGRKNADLLVGTAQDGHRSYSAGWTKNVDLQTLRFRNRPRCNHYSLYVKGFWFDTVAEVAQASQGGAIPGTWLDMVEWSGARRPLRPEADIGDPPDEFWRTLVADRGIHGRNPPNYYAEACKETILKGGLRSGAVDTTALIHNERNSIVAGFCRRVQAVIWNRALIRTENGVLGLVSDKVEEGDRICIIYGCTVPVILRKKGWKTEKQLEMEEYEDKVEAMKKLMFQCEENRARKARWEEARKTMDKKDLEETQKARKFYNESLEPNAELEDRQSRENENELYHSAAFDNESEDDFDSSRFYSESDDDTDKESDERSKGTRDDLAAAPRPFRRTTTGIKPSRQKRANARDKYRHYEFLGEAYIHGMMDGEAVRDKTYNGKPDHLFEIR